jgi:predicted RNase H-like nuclease
VACLADVSSHRKTQATAVEGESATVSAILGIDAAWTAGRPSGVALLDEQGGRWHCVALAPSYAQFDGLAAGRAVDWLARPLGSAPDLAALLAASRRLLDGKSVQVIAVDMPLSLEPIRGRRAADAAVSRAFGAQGCAVHSPSAERPGALADRLRADAENLGYPLATAKTPAGQTRALLEVYPHPALLRLLDARYRLPYKVANRRKYWPDASPDECLARVRQQLDAIRCALQRAVDGVPLDLPPLADIASAASLKAIEDSLDALVCGWVGIQYLAGRCRAYGDDTAAIWIPTADEE